MEPIVVEDLDPAATLAAVEDSLLARRRAEARDLALAAHWADLHAADPNAGYGAQRKWCGEDRLVLIGGEGTPEVQELSIAELAIAHEVHPLSARKLVADALDLRHRLPRCWAAVQALKAEAWVVRRVATMTRPLGPAGARLVDDAVGEELEGLSPARIFEVAQAKVIEADPDRHAAALDEQKRRRYVALSRTDELGLREVIARVTAGDAEWVDAMLERVADILTPRYPADTSRHELRSIAFGWLARPADLLKLLLAAAEDPTPEEQDLTTALQDLEPARLRPQVVLYVHLHEDAVRSDRGVARVEDVGPLLSREIPEWLGHSHVTVKPVLDLADQVATDAYEHPESLKERVHLRSPADSFPHANQVSRRLDHDHVVPWVPGQRGQTGDHNSQPLGRIGHRAKTHLGYRVRQLRPGVYAWRTPHHRYRLVDHRGTRVVPPGLGAGLLSDDAFDRRLSEVLLDHGVTGSVRRLTAPR